MQEHWCANRQMPAMKLHHKVSICLVLLAASSLPAPAQTVEEEETAPPEPPRIYQAACPALLNGRIKGRILPPIEEGECGENSPIEVTAIGEVDLSNPVTLNCRMATALHGWVDSVDYTALQLLKSQLFSLSVSTSYHCRRRNNAPDGKISEHGFLNALDITGFELANGTRITVLDDWPPVNYEEEEAESASDSGETEAEEVTSTGVPPESTPATFLRLVRDDACTRFTTVLGPEANALHADHFHLDLGCHGKNCTYTICE